MKIDRLIGITIYLLNRDVAKAKELARRFEVSVRTIVRDMEALSAAGIPVSSSSGPSGGYSIMEGYKLGGQMISSADQAAIINKTAEGFS